MLLAKCNIDAKIYYPFSKINLLFIPLVYYLSLCKTKSTTIMENISDRKRRSVPLTKEEQKALLKYVRSFPTKIDAAFALGISRPTLDLVIIRGSGNSDTVGLVREKLNSLSQSAA
jgi:hypothetical protein